MNTNARRLVASLLLTAATAAWAEPAPVTPASAATPPPQNSNSKTQSTAENSSDSSDVTPPAAASSEAVVTPLTATQDDAVPIRPGEALPGNLLEAPAMVPPAGDLDVDASTLIEIPATGMQAFLRQFQEQREVALADRQVLITQLQTVKESERAELVHAYRAEQAQQLAEQRELARQVREDLKRLREEHRNRGD